MFFLLKTRLDSVLKNYGNGSDKTNTRILYTLNLFKVCFVENLSFIDEKILKSIETCLRNYSKNSEFSEFSECFRAIIELIIPNQDLPSSSLKVSYPLIHIENCSNILYNQFDLLDLPDEEISRQLIIYSSKLFYNLKPQEIFYYRLYNDQFPSIIPNFLSLLNHEKNLIQYVLFKFTSQDSIEKKKDVIKKFVNIISLLTSQNCFSESYALYKGIKSPEIKKFLKDNSMKFSFRLQKDVRSMKSSDIAKFLGQKSNSPYLFPPHLLFGSGFFFADEEKTIYLIKETSLLIQEIFDFNQYLKFKYHFFRNLSGSEMY